jgi:hypothetical protein
MGGHSLQQARYRHASCEEFFDSILASFFPYLPLRSQGKFSIIDTIGTSNVANMMNVSLLLRRRDIGGTKRRWEGEVLRVNKLTSQNPVLKLRYFSLTYQLSTVPQRIQETILELEAQKLVKKYRCC